MNPGLPTGTAGPLYEEASYLATAEIRPHTPDRHVPPAPVGSGHCLQVAKFLGWRQADLLGNLLGWQPSFSSRFVHSYLKLFQSNKGATEIAERLGKSPHTVANKLACGHMTFMSQICVGRLKQARTPWRNKPSPWISISPPVQLDASLLLDLPTGAGCADWCCGNLSLTAPCRSGRPPEGQGSA